MKPSVVFMFVLISFLSAFPAFSQEAAPGGGLSSRRDSSFSASRPKPTSVALKTNLISGLGLTPNGGVELACDRCFSLEISGSYNSLDLSNDRKWQHWMIQQEFRFWSKQPFSGAFFGIYGFTGKFNMSGLPLGGLRGSRIEGSAIGGGVSYGYSRRLSSQWSLEATLGLGYVHFAYNKYSSKSDEDPGSYEKIYFGPTKIGVSLVYRIRKAGIEASLH